MDISGLNEERQQAIINAAMKEFAMQGYDQASTNKIAKSAGISKALMFHYVKSKEELFLFLLAYCEEQINQHYWEKLAVHEKDVLKRLHQSCRLQIELLRKNPWIFDFNQLSALTKSEAINEKMRKKTGHNDPLCLEELFTSIDETKFRQELTLESCRQLIYWSMIGFTAQQLEELKYSENHRGDYDKIVAETDNYFNDLRTVYYAH